MSVQSGSTPNTTMSDALQRAGAGQQSFNQQQNQQGQQQSAGRTGRTGRASIMGVNALAGRAIRRSSAGEAVLGYKKALDKVLDSNIEDKNQRNAFNIIVADASTAMIALSTLAATYEVNHNGTRHVAVCALVVEASGPKPAPRYITIGNTPVEIEQTAGDTVNPELWEKLTLLLGNHFGKAVFHNAGAMVLPKTLSPEDEAHMHEIVFSVGQALQAVIENDVTGEGLPISVSMVDQGSNVSASIDYNPAEVENALGQPLRSNLSITTRASMNQGSNTSLHEQQLDLTRVDGFIDLIYAVPQQPMAPINPYLPQHQQVLTQRYLPRFVITRLDSQVDAQTLELSLLSLASATLVSRQMAWAGVFLPRFNVSGQDLRDIGAIGYEVNLTNDPSAQPEPIPTKSETFGRRELYQLLQATISDSVVYSLDVEETGPQAWINQTFIAAANGIQPAYQAIVDAANNLTDGRFGQIWQGEPIAQDDQNRIHQAYYLDSQGRRCDSRDLDYVAMLNLLGGKDMTKFHEWVATFEDVNVPLEMRLHTRQRILQALVPDLQIVGFYRRITFMANFIAALETSIQQAGLVIRPNNVQVIEGPATQRGQFNTQAFAVNPQVGAGLFAYQTQPYGNYRGGMGQPFTGRFGAP